MNPETKVEEKRGERVEVERGRRLRITRRDRERRAMTMARYLSSEQIQRLFFSGRTESPHGVPLVQQKQSPDPAPEVAVIRAPPDCRRRSSTRSLSDNLKLVNRFGGTRYLAQLFALAHSKRCSPSRVQSPSFSPRSPSICGRASMGSLRLCAASGKRTSTPGTCLPS
jgi:hypothetical protein